MEFQEYPKALYKGGDQAAEHVIVADVKEEAAKRKAGFRMLGEPEDKPKKQKDGGAPAPDGDQQPNDQAPE